MKLIALIFQNEIVGYRCMPPEGDAVDISVDVLKALGIKPPDVMVKHTLHSVDGQLLTTAEIEHNRRVTDISNEPDRIKALFAGVKKSPSKSKNRKITFKALARFIERVKGVSLGLVVGVAHTTGKPNPPLNLLVTKGTNVFSYTLSQQPEDPYFFRDGRGNLVSSEVHAIFYPEEKVITEEIARKNKFLIRGYSNPLTDADIEWMVNNPDGNVPPDSFY